MGRTIQLPHPPKRIISLVPSQTELLFDIGLSKEVIGITKFCIHPEEMFRSKMRVGGTKNIDIEKVKSLKPDLIIGNKEENKKEQIEELMQLFPVWMSDIKSLDNALDMIEKLGKLVKKEEEAGTLQNEIQTKFNSLNSEMQNAKCEIKKVAYLIWRNPYMTINKDTFINHILERCSLQNVFANHSRRYPEINSIELAQASPELIFLSSEPYPFTEKHIQDLQNICPAARIVLVDGEMFSWYGSRLLLVPGYLKSVMKKVLPQITHVFTD